MSPSAAEFVVEVNEERFQTEVIEKSRTTPVLVDFWAPWCAPCRSLSPVLEKLAAEYDGAFILAKINTDENPGLAASFQVRSIPSDCEEAGGESRLRKVPAKDPGDLDSRMALASCLVAAGRYREALEEFLAVVSQDKYYRDEGARKAMLALFSLVGERSDLAEEFRGRLARTFY